MIWFIYPHRNKAFAIRHSALYGFEGKDFLSQHVVPLNIFKGSLIIVFSHHSSAYDYINKKRKIAPGVRSTLCSYYYTPLTVSTAIRRVNKA